MFDFFLYPHFLLPERGSSRSREKTCRASFWSHSSGQFPVVAGAWWKVIIFWRYICNTKYVGMLVFKLCFIRRIHIFKFLYG